MFGDWNFLENALKFSEEGGVMTLGKKCLVFLFLLIVAFWTVPAFAGQQLSVSQGIIKKIPSGSCFYDRCARVPIRVDENGYVVVTASGMASFDSRDSSLGLTLSRNPAAKGPWLFILTPGHKRFQTYTVRWVFPVRANRDLVFYLNGISCDGPGRLISVETGSITAEFYRQGDSRILSEVLAQDGAASVQEHNYGP